MKKLTFILFLAAFGQTFAQDWTSISRLNSFKYIPQKQFIIDPYRNDLWFVGYNNVSKINMTGVINEYGDNELGTIQIDDKCTFLFSKENVYYCKENEGIFSFNSDLSVPLYQLNEQYQAATNNMDTIYITSSSFPYIKYDGISNLNTTDFAGNIFSKNKLFYTSGSVNSGLLKFIGPSANDFEFYYQSDSHYLCHVFNDIKFSRRTDTLYVACQKGISFAYNYDFLDTITPYNTTNMPSANVLEMEFDEQDRLWAVFGDSMDNPFALARLDGTVWTNYYDRNNSPINFDSSGVSPPFVKLEIDTLGNVWVCDRDNLHVLKSPTNPSWVLGLEPLKTSSFRLYPNPTQNHIQLNWEQQGMATIRLKDLQGKILLDSETQEKSLKINLAAFQNGIYFIEWQQGDRIEYRKVVKQ